MDEIKTYKRSAKHWVISERIKNNLLAVGASKEISTTISKFAEHCICLEFPFLFIGEHNQMSPDANEVDRKIITIELKLGNIKLCQKKGA